MNLVTAKAGAKHEPLFNKPASALFTEFFTKNFVNINNAFNSNVCLYREVLLKVYCFYLFFFFSLKSSIHEPNINY